MSDDPLVVIGAGQAAAQLIASLAQFGYGVPTVVVGDEPYLPYQRPPLSKKFLAGEVALDQLYLKPQAFYEKAGTRLLLGCKVEAIHRNSRTVMVSGGTRLRYSTLVIATGSRARTLALPGADLAGVHVLRTIADVHALQPHLNSPKRLAIVGGGYIGLELAAVAAKHGMNVTVLEQAPRVMARGVGPVVSAFYERLHRDEGVQIVTNARITSLEGAGRVERVLCDDGPIVADLVVAGIGATPNVELAQAAGLRIDNGIVVDDRCRTEDPAILSIGDCANQMRPGLGRHLRLESVHGALEQARIAAAHISGRPLPAIQTPWFWTDQYDVKMQMAGLSGEHDATVVRGNPEQGRSFAVFYLQGQRLIAVDAINRVPEFMVSRQLIADHKSVDASRLADETVAMKEVALSGPVASA